MPNQDDNRKLTLQHTYFALMDRETQWWIPVAHRGTHAELTCRKPPRLFDTVRAAQQALTWWLKGSIHKKYIRRSPADFWNGEVEDEELVVDKESETERAEMKDRMVICECTFTMTELP